MLALRIDFLHGRFLAADPTGRSPEWPPHPDRVWQALVSEAYETGDTALVAAVRALESVWPEIHHGPATPADSGIHFVPYNHLGSGKAATYAPSMVGIADPLCYVWPGQAQLREPLTRLAAGLTYLGRAKSPVMARVVDAVPELPHHLVPDPLGRCLLRVPTAGRLDQLDRCFHSGLRAPPAESVPYADRADQIPAGPWGRLVALRPREGLGIEGAPQIAEALRAAVLHHAGDAASDLLHGHGRREHVAWTVLPDVGHPHARGRVLGVGLWLPARITEHERADCLLPLMRTDHLMLAGRRVPLSPLAAHAPVPQGLRESVWADPSSVWATVTPLVPDRHPRRGYRLEQAIADSVEAAGLPRPLEVSAHRISAIAGSPWSPAFRPRRGGVWTHAILTFGQAVRGPVLIGRERHFGLGLCRPLREP